MPVPTRTTADARRKNFDRLGKAYNTAKSTAKSAGKFASKALFGDDGRIPTMASLIPGADLVDKLSSGKAPGLLDFPGLNDLKALKALMLAGVPVSQLFKQFGRKIGQSDDVAEAFAERMGRLSDELQDATARTIAGKESGFPGYKIPPISKGNARPFLPVEALPITS